MRRARKGLWRLPKQSVRGAGLILIRGWLYQFKHSKIRLAQQFKSRNSNWLEIAHEFELLICLPHDPEQF